ncbi:hypothetical protein SAMN05216489_05876 [Streptomyces sp. 3213]|uniref:hypothetical protein n=1 Tax=Streptomyces sp. 3213.3 TaxID=1855348 RepID=UPI000896FD19|nr:hypothetical protein [Streptomyces sp. 3213.3]SEE21616.1 hypothetical protein SAMN05216489_05876 [Streptomyces sp. 3213] [Streptomyces sp. 3213.3]
MQTRGRRLRFTAVLALTVLTLTGFSTGRHHSGSRHRSGGGGGGCSSSSQDHDTSTTTTGGSSGGSSYTHRPDYRSTPTSTATSGSGTSSLQDGTAKLVSCATATRQYATVEVSNPNSRKATFSVDVTFEDAQDNEIDYDYVDVKVPANGKATVRVRFLGSSTPLDHCVVDRRATAVS